MPEKGKLRVRFLPCEYLPDVRELPGVQEGVHVLLVKFLVALVRHDLVAEEGHRARLPGLTEALGTEGRHTAGKHLPVAASLAGLLRVEATHGRPRCSASTRLVHGLDRAFYRESV